MFNSKLFTGIIAITFAALAATVAFQLLEMKEYNLFEMIEKQLFGEEEEEAPAPAPAETPPAEANAGN